MFQEKVNKQTDRHTDKHTDGRTHDGQWAMTLACWPTVNGAKNDTI